MAPHVSRFSIAFVFPIISWLGRAGSGPGCPSVFSCLYSHVWGGGCLDGLGDFSDLQDNGSDWGNEGSWGGGVMYLSGLVTKDVFGCLQEL